MAIANNGVLQKEQITEQLMKDLANNHPELSFEQVLTMVKKTLPNDYVPLMNIYALHVKRLRHVQDAFEYANLFRQVDTLGKMIQIHENDDLLQEWVQVYRFFYDFLPHLKIDDVLIRNIRNLFGLVKHPQLRMRLEIAELNYFDNHGIINNLTPMMKQFKEQFKTMPSGFFKSALAARVTLLAGNASLFGDGDYEEAERCYLAATVIEAIPDVLLVTAYHGLGLVYLKDNKQQCLDAHQKALFYAQRSKLDHYHQNLEYDYIPFVKNMLGEIFDIDHVTPKEQAHQYVVRGETRKALEIISQLETPGKKDAHLLFYKAKALKSIPLFFETIKAFSSEGYTHMIGFAEKEIKKIKFF
ncbi:AimR family lysis-lysogeny pheromone receptor [Shouchella clausii]|uniref:AimR family lysis-lysogeny pheromone receptor n=1 Tax=Shouchella clausii TaxID=79880 RepID=UPI000B9680D5|nr:AimR family lysis-lysogeny pheromone receptor [Shouchella clausii]AST94664.1 hypothetical protein BC8716_01050 [Shouchella clausii]MEB5475159.1 AimR family lysis-lysogeny pheromone receptor [Shouchella clausii]QNM45103.1 hypothetical protein DUT88_20465 [Shouchella clausii]WQG96177.1 AimR family lysis-lysogeny pheromone receptor [Shouchella clausii]